MTTAPLSIGTASVACPGRGREVVDTVARGLAVPWGLAFLPDGHAVVSGRDSAGPVIAGSDHAVTEVGQSETGRQGEGGLLGVAVSPAFAQDGLLYVYVSGADDNRIVTRRARRTAIGETEPILTGIPAGSSTTAAGWRSVRTACSTSAPARPATASRAGPRFARRQDPAGHAGRASPHPGNPIDAAVWSYGHRNVQGLAFDDEGRLWAERVRPEHLRRAEPDRAPAATTAGRWSKAPAASHGLRRPAGRRGQPTTPRRPASRSSTARSGWRRCVASDSGRYRVDGATPATRRPTSTASTAGCGPSPSPRTATLADHDQPRRTR